MKVTPINARLTALAMKTAPPSQMADGRGLIFDKGATSAKWLYRYSYGGKHREMGLRGSPPPPKQGRTGGYVAEAVTQPHSLQGMPSASHWIR